MNRSDSDLSTYFLVSNTAEMKFLFLVAVLAMAVTLIKGYTDEEQWRDFKRKHKLNYNIPSDNGREDRKRKTLFLESKKKLKEDSKVPMSFFQQLNAFSVLRPVEKQRFLGINASLVPSDRFMESIKDEFQIKDSLPLSLDYRYDSCLTPVRNQGSCGSCWAFSAITPLEFSRCKNVNAPVVLSEQQLVDCDTTNYGCNGGWYVTAWTHVQQGSGSIKRTLYPYTARKGTCRLNNSAIEARVNTFNYVATLNAPAMQVALQKYGPIAVAMTVVNSFYNYAGGVYNDPACDGKAVNHGVVIVGWGVLNGIDFWIVRNTWGYKWGDNGYALIQRGVNKCGIEIYPAYATAY